MNMRVIVAAIAASALSIGAAQAHGSGAHASASGHPGTAKDATRTVRIDASEYQFVPEALTFKAGETIKFVVTNSGGLKHEFTIGNAEEQAQHRQEMAKMSDMGHDEGTHAMPTNSVHVGPGETRELIWTFTQGGNFQFACNYPGHADLGMEGAITVQ